MARAKPNRHDDNEDDAGSRSEPKAGAPGGQPGRKPDPDRDLVFFFSRLTQSLEQVDAQALAARLTELRRTPPDDDANPVVPAIGRSFRRLGLMTAGDEAAAFIPGFVERVGTAVSRQPQHVLALLKLFSVGDDALKLKPVCGPTPDCSLCKLTRECDYFNNPRKPIFALMTPVERLLSGNEQALSDAELLAVSVFGEKGTGQEPVIQTLMARYGRLRAVFRAESGEYAAIRGMTRPQTVRLASTAAMYRRLLAERRGALLHIGSARDIYLRYAPELREYHVEAAVLLMLDQHNNVIRDAWFCGNSPNSAVVAIADLLRPAVREFAVRIALIHNHPSDNPAPSEADRAFTRDLAQACDIFHIGFVDHVIVTESSYFSFAESGLL